MPLLHLRFPKLTTFFAIASLAMLATAAPLSAQTVETWQKAAVQKYPALAEAGSPLNQRFLAIVTEKRKSDPAYFSRADWPMRTANAAAEALKAEELAASQKAKAEEDARLAKMPPEEQEWERNKARWVFEKLIFGDGEEVVVSKLNKSKLISSRVSPSMRVPVNSRFQWVQGESKFNLDFEMTDKDTLTAIIIQSKAEKNDTLAEFIHEDWEKLRKLAIEQFGPAAKSVAFPDEKTLKIGGWSVTDTWTKGGARIKLGVIENEGHCTAALRISDPAHAPE